MVGLGRIQSVGRSSQRPGETQILDLRRISESEAPSIGPLGPDGPGMNGRKRREQEQDRDKGQDREQEVGGTPPILAGGVRVNRSRILD